MVLTKFIAHGFEYYRKRQFLIFLHPVAEVESGLAVWIDQ